MVLVVKNIEEGSLHKQLEKLLKDRNSRKKKRSWNKFFGKVKSIKNPVDYQRNLRDK
jgi:hypothetical protein